jgi:hypothetical protein
LLYAGKWYLQGASLAMLAPHSLFPTPHSLLREILFFLVVIGKVVVVGWGGWGGGGGGVEITLHCIEKDTLGFSVFLPLRLFFIA